MNKLIILYGLPATGKLTIAKELEQISNSKIVHNHLINDFVSRNIKFNTTHYWKVCDKIKKALIVGMMKDKDSNIIFTQGFDGKSRLVKRTEWMIEQAKKNKYLPCLVKLECDKKELLRRVGMNSRIKHGKITDKKLLENYISRINPNFRNVNFKNQIIIDTSKTTAKRSAKKIKKKFKVD